MKSTDNKKAPESWRSRSLIAVNKGILTMSNITHITEANQVQISQHQLERSVDFINNAKNGFSDLQTLVTLIMEKSEKHTTAYTLASITWDHLNKWVDECCEEVAYFEQHSPKAAKLLAQESVA